MNSLNKMADLKSKIGEEDRNFFKQLEERCHILRHDSSVHPPLSYDDYHFVTLTTQEVKKILSIAQKNDDVFLRPINGKSGLHPAFAIIAFSDSFPGTEGDHDWLLQFDQDQLPKGYNFQTLEPYFANEDNLRKAKFANMEFETEEHHYTY